MKKYITKKRIVYNLIPLFMVGIIFIENPAKAAAPSYTWTNYNAGDVQYKFPATVSSEYGEFVYMESGTPDDTYYFSWDIPIPISATIVSGYYMNGYSILTIDITKSFGQGTTVRSLTYELTESTGIDYYSYIYQVWGNDLRRVIIRTNYINTYTHTGDSRSLNIGTLHLKVQGTSSSPYDDMSITIAGQTTSSDSNVTYSLEAKLDQYYFDMLYALGNASEIDDIVYYLTALATYGANVSGYLSTIRYEQLPNIISYLTNIQTYTQNTATSASNIALAAGQINTHCINMYATLQNIYGVDQTISADLQDLISILQSSIAAEQSKEAAEASQGEAIADTVEQAGQSLEDLGSQLAVETGDPEDWLNDMSNAVNQEAMNQQGNVFKWTENSRIIMYLTIVFTFGLIGYLLYGRN